MTSSSMRKIAIILPSYNPDANLPALIRRLQELTTMEIIVVNDGSKKECAPIFDEVKRLGATLIEHAVNLGKGRALKTAFNYFLSRYPDGGGATTADADGQHAPKDILNVANAMNEYPDSVILGVREFHSKDVPFKSRFGNLLTCKVLKLFSGGLNISDTQTGLRGIPASFMRELMNCHGERFEFETRMLLLAHERDMPIRETPIQTIYINSNRETHFDPIRDSIRIYRILFSSFFRRLFRFLVSSGLSAVADILLFYLFFRLFTDMPIPRLFAAVLLARIISSTLNYLLNKNLVFRQNSSGREFFSFSSYWKYGALCVLICAASYYGTRLAVWAFGTEYIVLEKIIVDTFLFFASFFFQSLVVFARGKR